MVYVKKIIFIFFVVYHVSHSVVGMDRVLQVVNSTLPGTIISKIDEDFVHNPLVFQSHFDITEGVPAPTVTKKLQKYACGAIATVVFNRVPLYLGLGCIIAFGGNSLVEAGVSTLLMSAALHAVVINAEVIGDYAKKYGQDIHKPCVKRKIIQQLLKDFSIDQREVIFAENSCCNVCESIIATQSNSVQPLKPCLKVRTIDPKYIQQGVCPAPPETSSKYLNAIKECDEALISCGPVQKSKTTSSLQILIPEQIEYTRSFHSGFNPSIVYNDDPDAL